MEVVVVAGPPCSGKTTYVREHANPAHDIVFDYDAIAVALGSPDSHDHPDHLPPFIWAAKKAILRQLLRPGRRVHTLWLIKTGARRHDRQVFPSNEIVVLDVDADECKRRAREAGRPAQWAEYIDKWWTEYEPPFS